MSKIIRHGATELLTRFDIELRQFSGNEENYTESLFVADAPVGRCAFIIHEYAMGRYHAFFEFDTLEHLDLAVAQLQPHSSMSLNQRLSNQPGYIRHIECGRSLPWFFAHSDLPMKRDYADPPRSFEDTLDPDSPTVKGLTVID